MANYLINGKTPDALGISVATRQLVNQGIDTVTLMVTRELKQGAPFHYDQDVIISQNGVNWFRGKVMTRSAFGQPLSEGYQITIGNAWWLLSRLPYVRRVALPSGYEEQVARYWQGLDDAGRLQTSSQILTQLFTYVKTKIPSMDYGDISLDRVIPATVPKVDRRTHELVSDALVLHPDVALWWDYSGDRATALFTKRGEHVITLQAGVNDVTDEGITPRPELIPGGVIFRYENSTAALAQNGGRRAVLIDAFPAGTAADSMDVLIQTVTIPDSRTRVQKGSAKRLYDALAVLTYEGTVTITKAECDTGIRPGHTINIKGRDPAWANMNAFVQSVTEDVDKGMTTLTFGLPQHWGTRPTMRSIQRSQSEAVNKDVTQAGEEKTEDVEVPEGNLIPYLRRTPSGLWGIFVTPGIFQDGSPEGGWPFTMNGRALSNRDEAGLPPYRVIVRGQTWPIFATVRADPKVQTFNFVDADGNPVVEYAGTGGIVTKECAVTNVMTSPRLAIVNAETGTIEQDHRIYFRLGVAEWPISEDRPKITEVLWQGSNMSFFFSPVHDTGYLLPA